MRARVVGAVLAGGASARMGAPKAGVALPDGRRLGEVAVQALSGACDAVVALGHGEGLPEALARIPDRAPGAGPLGGIDALLAGVEADCYLLCPCDLPRVDAAALSPLRDAVLDGAAAAAWGDPESPAGLTPLPCALSPRAASAVATRLDDGRRSVAGLLLQLGAAVLAPDEGVRAALRGVNTPEELAAMVGAGADPK